MQAAYTFAKAGRLIASLGYPDYRYSQLAQAVFRQGIGRFSQMKTLPKPLRETLEREIGPSVCSLALVEERSSPQVQKSLFELEDGERIEAVALRYRRGWESFCISSQCGCGFGCRFCATGAMGLHRNLSAGEIADQLLYFHLNGHRLDSVSFMGMGEPLANPQVFEALSLITDPMLLGLGQRRITVSTVGMVPGIEKMTAGFPQVNLAFSLHSPFDGQRSELMPVNRAYPMEEVMGALDQHIQRTGRKVFVAYALLKDVNDSQAHARALGALLSGRGPKARLYHVDLISYNPAKNAPARFSPTGKAKAREFQRTLQAAGVSVTLRNQFGAGIDAACGQLSGCSPAKTSP